MNKNAPTLIANSLIPTGVLSSIWALMTLRPLLAVTFVVIVAMAHPLVYQKVQVLLKVPASEMRTFAVLYALLAIAILARWVQLSHLAGEPHQAIFPMHMQIDTQSLRAHPHDEWPVKF